MKYKDYLTEAVLPSRTDFGFLDSFEGPEKKTQWDKAFAFFTKYAKANSVDVRPEDIRNFLESRIARHVGGYVKDGASMEQAVDKYATSSKFLRLFKETINNMRDE